MQITISSLSIFLFFFLLLLFIFNLKTAHIIYNNKRHDMILPEYQRIPKKKEYFIKIFITSRRQKYALDICFMY